MQNKLMGLSNCNFLSIFEFSIFSLGFFVPFLSKVDFWY